MKHKLGKLSICSLQNKQSTANLQNPFIAPIKLLYLFIVVLSLLVSAIEKGFNEPINSRHASTILTDDRVNVNNIIKE